MAPSHLILSDTERLKSRSLTFQSSISHKGAKELCHMPLLKSNRKLHINMGSSAILSDSTLSGLDRSK